VTEEVVYVGGIAMTPAEYRRLQRECKPRSARRPKGWRGRWPIKSVALAVHPDQVAEANARNKAHGVNVQYEPSTGKAVIPDAAAYKRLRRIEGVIDRDGYSGY
jgi:hypothetical protein